MKNLIFLISLIFTTVKCQPIDADFRLNGLEILSRSQNNKPYSKNLIQSDLNSGFENKNHGMGLILGNNLASLSSNNLKVNLPNLNNNNNQYPQLPQMPQLPSFTDNLNYQRSSLTLPQEPQTNAFSTPIQNEYKNVILKSDPILAPGRLAPLPQLPELPTILPEKVEPVGLKSPPFTANIKENRNLPTFDFKQPLFNVPLTSNNNVLLNKNNHLPNTNLVSGIVSSLDKIPIEVSQFSTRIVHEIPAKLPEAQPPTLLFKKGSGY